jgi:hypothetical protein
MKKAAVREQLEDLNRHSDGPCEVAIIAKLAGSVLGSGTLLARRDTARVAACPGSAVVTTNPHTSGAEFEAEAVVTVPGDGKPFPVASFVEALLCAEVQFEP